jgi:hypothetical protein
MLSHRALDEGGELLPVLLDLGLEFGDPRGPSAEERLIPGKGLRQQEQVVP